MRVFDICVLVAFIFTMVLGIYWINDYNSNSYKRYSHLESEYWNYRFETERRIEGLKRIIEGQEYQIKKLKGLE